MLNHDKLSTLIWEYYHPNANSKDSPPLQWQKCKDLATKVLSADGKDPDPEQTIEDFKAKWLQFAEEYKPGRLTRLFRVYNSENGYDLGTIKWSGQFRAYAFFPASDCVFETTCLGNINEFIRLLMQEWRKNQKEKKKS